MGLFDKDSPIRIGDYAWIEKYGEPPFVATIASTDEDSYYCYRLTDYNRGECFQRHRHSVSIYCRRERARLRCCWRFNETNTESMTLAYIDHGSGECSQALREGFSSQYPSLIHSLDALASIPDGMWESLSEKIASHTILSGTVKPSALLEEWTGWTLIETGDSMPFETPYPSISGKWIQPDS